MFFFFFSTQGQGFLNGEITSPFPEPQSHFYLTPIIMLHLLKKEQEIGQERQVECLQEIFMEDTLSANTTLKVFL